jgi:iron complex transport system ATP-binding protein
MDIVYEAMEMTHTLQFADCLVTQISGGEFQRVLFARALTQTPKVLFLDEAFSAMDVSYRIQSLKQIQELVKMKKLTVVSIIHDLNLAYTFSDQVCVLKEGTIFAMGKPDEVMTETLIYDVFNIDVCKVKDQGFLVAI